MHHRVTAALLCAVATVGMLVAAPMAEGRATSRVDSVEQRVIALINGERARHGLASVSSDTRLNRSANSHSRDMLRNDFFGHTSRNGRSMGARVNHFRPSRRVAETLAYVERGASDAARRIVDMWMDSTPHRHVLLTAAYRRIGVARQTGSLGSTPAMVFTANFSTRR